MSISRKLPQIHQKLRNRFGKRRPIEEYIPSELSRPNDLIRAETAWAGLEGIISDILRRFGVPSSSCIEFGVEFGYSTVVFSNYFEKVVGIDTFEGDINTSHQGNHFAKTSARLSAYPGIELHMADYRDWIATDTQQYDLAHVDIVHTYEDTLRCGLWAAAHSKVALFHDTESFIDVRNAVVDIARQTGGHLYNYPHCNGLGILVSRT